jgi:hypothetical protein
MSKVSLMHSSSTQSHNLCIYLTMSAAPSTSKAFSSFE